ncbi:MULTISPECIES: hypothetical protein [Aeromonas]|uniref:hypothetical protein n=1 Tax=Aeromonas TaxID=642 RepID=UPI001F279701|nr:hypothetical protein [Aeromonas sp. QDB11]MCE9951991.1 hypothetical protein [Aeromonas allosaccharophila]
MESLIYPAFLNAKAPLDERGFFMTIFYDCQAGFSGWPVGFPVRPATEIVIPALSSSSPMQA